MPEINEGSQRRVSIKFLVLFSGLCLFTGAGIVGLVQIFHHEPTPPAPQQVISPPPPCQIKETKPCDPCKMFEPCPKCPPLTIDESHIEYDKYMRTLVNNFLQQQNLVCHERLNSTSYAVVNQTLPTQQTPAPPTTAQPPTTPTTPKAGVQVAATTKSAAGQQGKTG